MAPKTTPRPPPPLTTHQDNQDDQDKRYVTFSRHLIFYVIRYCGLFNIASWLASNKTLSTRESNKIQVAMEFFVPRTSGIFLVL